MRHRRFTDRVSEACDKRCTRQADGFGELRKRPRTARRVPHQAQRCRDRHVVVERFHLQLQQAMRAEVLTEELGEENVRDLRQDGAVPGRGGTLGGEQRAGPASG